MQFWKKATATLTVLAMTLLTLACGGMADNYTDVSAGAWYYDYVTALSADGVVNGYPDGSFGPTDTLTAGAALKLIFLAAGYDEQSATSSNWASGYLSLAVSKGFLDEGEVTDLDGEISRLEIAKLAAKALGMSKSDTATVFSDTDNKYVMALYDTGIFEGSTENGSRVFKPSSSITRAEISAVIYRMDEYAAGKTTTSATGTGTASIALSGAGATVTGSGASASGGVVTITSGGAYTVSGTLTEGQIIVNAQGEDVTLILNGANISCSYSSPIFIYKSSSTTITLASGTSNSLSDGSSYTYADEYSIEADEEPNACLYSKSDLAINGTGSLTVNGSFNNGITSKDTLSIENAVLNVTAVNHGINGKDYNAVSGATVTVTAGGDALRSTNDTDTTLGYVTIKNSTLKLNAGEDGIQSETTLDISGGSLDITSGDDAIHGGGNVTVSGGTFEISAGDDAIHSDATTTVSGGTINISKSYEGIEGMDIVLSGGTVYITASDDGINAAGGTDSSGYTAATDSISPVIPSDGTTRGMGGTPPTGFTGGRDDFGGGAMVGDTNHSVTISGGYYVVNASGDGLDSNGSITQSGGTVIILGPTNDGNGALDYGTNYFLTGGTLLAEGSAGMAQTPDNPSQYVISVTFDSNLAAGSFVQLKSASNTFVFKIEKTTRNLVFSSPDITKGESYEVSYGGTYSGTATDCVCSGGTYSGGAALTTLTISDYLTTYGQAGMGGTPGGHIIGRPGDWGTGKGEGQTPPDGITPPTKPTGTAA